MDLLAGHAPVDAVQRPAVEVFMHVALVAQHRVDARFAPARPVVRGEHYAGLCRDAVEHPVDATRPVRRIAHLHAPTDSMSSDRKRVGAICPRDRAGRPAARNVAAVMQAARGSQPVRPRTTPMFAGSKPGSRRMPGTTQQSPTLLLSRPMRRIDGRRGST
jgi:hypothetical protein